MKRGQNAMWVAVAAAALLLLGLLLFFPGKGSSNPDIVLPSSPPGMNLPSSAPDNAPEADPNAPSLVEITPQNVTKIVADLKRPAEYSAVNRTTRYWAGGEALKTYKVYVLGDYSRVDGLNADSQVEETVIFTPETVYMPLGGQDQPMARGEFTPDAAMAMPTYEDVLNINESDIVGAGYVRRNDRPCVWVQTQDGLGYDIEYWIDLESGLLSGAVARQNGLSAWSFELTGLSLEKPDDNLFVLPSGVSVIAN